MVKLNPQDTPERNVTTGEETTTQETGGSPRPRNKRRRRANKRNRAESSRVQKEEEPETKEMEELLSLVQHTDADLKNNPDSDKTWAVETFGDPPIDQDESKVLELRPEFALFPKLTTSGILEEIESVLAKIRWHRNAADRGKERLRQVEELRLAGEDVSSLEVGTEQDRSIYNDKEKTLNMSQMRPTDMRDNRRIIMPPPRAAAEEIGLAGLRSSWM